MELYYRGHLPRNKVENLCDSLTLSDNADLSELIIHPHCQSIDDIQKYDFEYWAERALSRKVRQKMVLYTIDLEADSFVKPLSFQENYHDGYLDLGIEIFPRKCQTDDFNYLPITERGEHPALLLDRDGVINQDSGYLYQYEEVKWVEGIIPLIRFARAAGARVVVLSNQSGIGRDYYTIEQMHQLHEQMNEQLTEWDCHVDEWYFCPYHSDGVNEYKGYSLLRKPYPAMALLAQSEFNLDLKNSVMIGDKKTDRLDDLDIQTFFLEGNYTFENDDDVFKSHEEILNHLKNIHWP